MPGVDAAVALGPEAQRFEVKEEERPTAEGIKTELVGEGEQAIEEPPAQEGDGVHTDGAGAVAAYDEPLREHHE